jgi:hypothetical protein
MSDKAELAALKQRLLDERDAESADKLCMTVEQLRAIRARMQARQSAKPARKARRARNPDGYTGTGHAWAAYDEA